MDTTTPERGGHRHGRAGKEVLCASVVLCADDIKKLGPALRKHGRDAGRAAMVGVMGLVDDHASRRFGPDE